MRDTRLLAALALSFVLHLSAALSPGWRLPPADDEPDMSATLYAQLAPARRAPAAAALPRPQPRKPKAQETAAPAVLPPPAVAPAPQAVEEPALVAPPAGEGAGAAETPAPAAVELPLPRQGRIRFLVAKGEGELGTPLGESVHTWRHDDAAYFMQTLTETTGLIALFRPVRIVQTSEGSIGAAGLMPREFRVERNGQPAEAARFDWEAMKVTLAPGRERALAPGAQDLLTQMYQVGMLGTAARLEMMVATGKNYGRYAFEAVGEERIATRFGELRTWHVKTPALPGEQETDLWLASDYYNLPVRIRYRDRKGDVFEQNAVELEADGARLAVRPE